MSYATGKMDDMQELNIAIELSREVGRRVVEMNKAVGKVGRLAYQFGSEAIPHLTLYSVAYPDDQVVEVKRALHQLVQRLPMFEITLSHLVVDPNDPGFTEVMAEPTKDLLDLHYQVMELCNPLRRGYIKPRYLDPTFLQNYPPGEAESIKQWGRPIVGKYYVPHISVGRRVDGVPMPANLEWTPLIMKVTNLMLGKSGEWGTVREVVEVFPLVK